MRKMILTGLFLFIIAPLAAEEIIIEEAETDVKLEKAEAELDYMKEKVDFYKRVVRSVQREEEELKALKRIRVRK
ncbi:Uncharacterised protein [Sebaldella termitidis]|jgi:hypothetical protein|uniref:Uncharacterized protein n=1 Tax=Sebaldella termitidis (strain ATCC 33386 / NCTC 11300) TaxID=526218 RepID=D1AFH6_SEBTE|nr:hypothetical protein [Sebaldella termitidis]ACZ07861.1 hypothetical protein Sterm_0993 [Sebaldella termitidis ATCC 33386]SUI23162.1 Uncharacterised protein [Sebaldella termitidis]